MSIRDDRRTEALRLVSEHLLEVGLPGSSLRNLAAAAGVSDRMLLYYFADKNEVLTLALSRLATEMGAVLDRSVPASPRREFASLLGELREAVRGPALRRFLRLWLEIASRAARGEAPYGALACVIAESFAGWIAVRLAAAHAGEAALMLAAVEGIVVLDGIGRGDLADTAVASLPPPSAETQV